MGASNQDGHNQVPTNTAIRILNKPYTPNDCALYMKIRTRVVRLNFKNLNQQTATVKSHLLHCRKTVLLEKKTTRCNRANTWIWRELCPVQQICKLFLRVMQNLQIYKVREVAEMGNLDKEFPLILLIQRINGEHYCIQKVYK